MSHQIELINQAILIGKQNFVILVKEIVSMETGANMLMELTSYIKMKGNKVFI